VDSGEDIFLLKKTREYNALLNPAMAAKIEQRKN
jgi:hypothetical protein